jgi:hypothetical protein
LAFEIFSLGGFPFDLIISDNTFLQMIAKGNAATNTVTPTPSSSSIAIVQVAESCFPTDKGENALTTLLKDQMVAVLAKHHATLPPFVATLIQDCTHRDPTKRPSFSTLIQTTNARAASTALMQAAGLLNRGPVAPTVQLQVNEVTNDVSGRDQNNQRLRADSFC